MARVTKAQYVNRHAALQGMWIECRDLFAVVSSTQQRDLHRYYAVTKQLGDDALMSYRTTVSQADPSLSQRAGKTYQHMRKVQQAAIAHAAGDTAKFEAYVRKSARWSTAPAKHGLNTRVAVIARPEPDTDRLIAALLAIVEELPEEERERLLTQVENKSKAQGRKDSAA